MTPSAKATASLLAIVIVIGGYVSAVAFAPIAVGAALTAAIVIAALVGVWRSLRDLFKLGDRKP